MSQVFFGPQLGGMRSLATTRPKSENAEVGSTVRRRRCDIPPQIGFNLGGTVMSINELAPVLRSLDRADKLRVMHILIEELANEENALLETDSYPVWSPYASFEAADMLLDVLETEHQHG